MNLTQHPEYAKYLKDQDTTEAMHTALPPWILENEGAGQALETAVFQLIALFQEYNRVMWHEHPFCQMCLGGCCVVGASEVTPIDAAALTILGHVIPVLPAQTHHNERACIYLGEHGCSWPANWRPLKCMTFFSLGSGDWQLDSSDARYGRLNEALQAILDKYLPDIMSNMLELDTRGLADPILFAPILAQALTKQFLPLEMDPENGRSPLPLIDPTTIALLAIATLLDQVLANPPVNIDQLLLDIEQFEWVITGHPTQENEILVEINGRYLAFTSENPTSMQFSQDIEHYLTNTHQNMEIL